MTDKKTKLGTDVKVAEQIGAAIQRACSLNYGELSSGFLCRSVGSLNPVTPICVPEHATLKEVIAIFQKNKIGSVVVVDHSGKLSGIFTERDCVLKVLGKEQSLEQSLIKDLMTKDPVAESPQVTIAFALNLMSHGGFRHIPLIDEDRMPIGIISVKDVVDYLVLSMTKENLLAIDC